MPRYATQSITETAEQFDRLPDSAMVDRATVSSIFQCGPSTIYRWVVDGTLPAPKKIGGVVRWNVGELRAVLAGKAA